MAFITKLIIFINISITIIISLNISTVLSAQSYNTHSYKYKSTVSVFCRDDPPKVPNSEHQSDGISSVLYACADGYFRSGNSYTSTCDHDTRTWAPVDLTCAHVDCLTPPILHGAVVSTADFIDLFLNILLLKLE